MADPKMWSKVIEMATATINRSAQDLRTIFSKNSGSIATPGSVSYLLQDYPNTIDVFAQFEIADAISTNPAS